MNPGALFVPFEVVAPFLTRMEFGHVDIRRGSSRIARYGHEGIDT